MADSIRQRICSAFDTRLKGITVAAGYATNVGQNVFEWIPAVIDQDQTPGILWMDVDESPSNLTTAGTIGYHDHRLRIEARIIASGSTSIATIRKALADVVRAIGVDTTWGGLASRTNPVANDMDAEKADRLAAAMRLTIEIDYTTHKWNPYG
jgi:hypothetical protein